jgi:ACT domain-containing protein
MANEELIYRITRAVYERLGANADEAMVSNLVTDIYRAVEPSPSEVAKASSRTRSETDAMRDATDAAQRIIVSVFGVDRPGIVSAVSNILAESECSIVDINQTVVQGKFAMVLIADTRRARQTAAELKDRFRKEGDRLGIRIYAQREDIFNAMHRI